MKALIYNNGKINFTEKEKPTIIEPTDAIVKVTLSSICTSDLHIIKGFVPQASNNIVLGHEFVGEVVEIGEGIKSLKIGDRVSANCETFCGECYFCKKGYINNCEVGGWKLGCKIDGCQAEYVRVPFAEMGLTKIPNNVSFKEALFVGDILSSGYFSAEMCEIKKDDTIAIIGAGPVGLCAMASAKIINPCKTIAIDIDDYRLKLVQKLGLADYIFNPRNCNIKQEVLNITNNRGADGVIEASGANESFQVTWNIARANAVVGIVAMYEENQVIPLPKMYGKNLTFKTGGVDAIHCKELLDLIANKKLNTDFLVSKTFDFNNILEAYKYFENKTDNCLKVAIKY